ncbi:hypothetical protein B488_11370 [Liberibacter crescens BT-1]|uniref:Uncharacterized protein n=1 Tax=Liberibacter crescens (strain BT-1) TaxID=1215343 RepID=L0EUA8_LIBCB|nr:hypothetical protein [Liberibacter crescens]AGA65129.1 hypothetical protein B488_11370 [Liberibacter crescens BT-1]AMC13100.1 hypothetical protein RL73_05765 [Liberibacter crescens]
MINMFATARSKIFDRLRQDLCEFESDWCRSLYDPEKMLKMFLSDFERSLMRLVEEAGGDDDPICLMLSSYPDVVKSCFKNLEGTIFLLENLDIYYSIFKDLHKDLERFEKKFNGHPDDLKTALHIFLLSIGCSLESLIEKTGGEKIYIRKMFKNAASAVWRCFEDLKNNSNLE